MIEGYLPDVPYMATFIREIAPSWLDRVAVGNGVLPPRASSQQSFRYCELGCGLGVTPNILAATCPSGVFVGIDVLDYHIDYAKKTSAASGITNTLFKAGTFEETLDEQFEAFDYIVAHGVYSWIDQANCNHLLNFMERFLKPGGLCYISYNTLPGWNRWAPVQKLLLSIIDSCEDDPITCFKTAVETIREMKILGARYLNDNVMVDEFLNRADRLQIGYLVHEYLIPAWNPAYSIDVSSECKKRGLTFVGNAEQIKQRDDFIFKKNQIQLLDSSSYPSLRELNKDIILNTSFRRDVFVKSAKNLNTEEIFNMKSEQVFALNPASKDQDFMMRTAAGTLRFDNQAAKEIVAKLLCGPIKLSDIASDCMDESVTTGDVVNTADALWAVDIIRPVDQQVECPSLDKLNAALKLGI